VAGNASGDWGHQIDSNQLWLKSITVSGFSSGAYLPAHPHVVRPALDAALNAVAAGLGETEIDVLPFSEAVTAHERMEGGPQPQRSHRPHPGLTLCQVTRRLTSRTSCNDSSPDCPMNLGPPKALLGVFVRDIEELPGH
jgi:hypothetical protein